MDSHADAGLCQVMQSAAEPMKPLQSHGILNWLPTVGDKKSVAISIASSQLTTGISRNHFLIDNLLISGLLQEIGHC